MRTIEMRSDCKVCQKPLPNSRYRTFCSKFCRRQFHNKKNYIKRRQVVDSLSPIDELAPTAVSAIMEEDKL